MEDQEFLYDTIELLIDQLHNLTEQGNLKDAEAVADRIRELQEMTWQSRLCSQSP